MNSSAGGSVMENCASGKVLVVSHTIPPSHSGQAVALYQLLSGLPAGRYCLLSGRQVKNARNAATEELPGAYHRLKLSRALPIVDFPGVRTVGLLLSSAWIKLRARQIERVLQEEGCRLAVACTGDLYNLPAAYLACSRLRIDLIPYMFDDYAYQWTGARRTMARLLEPLIVKYACRLIVPNEFLRDEYRRRYGVESAVVHNPVEFFDLEELDGAKRYLDQKFFNIVFTGAVYHANFDAFRNLIAALGRLDRADLKLHIYSAQNPATLKKNGISGRMVVFHQHIHRKDVPYVLRQADMLFLPLAFRSAIQEVIRTSAPGKMGEYLASGSPVLVHAPEDSFVSWYFRANRCGSVVSRDDSGLLAMELERLMGLPDARAEFGKLARKAAERDFSLEKNRELFGELLEFKVRI